MLICIETHRTCDFPGVAVGTGPLSLLWIRTCRDSVGRALNWGSQFKTHRRRSYCVMSLGKILYHVLVKVRKTGKRAEMTEKLLTWT